MLLTMTAGDIAFTGFSSDDGAFSFVLLKDVQANDTISFTDKSWNESTAALAANSSGETARHLTFNAAFSAGTLIHYSSDNYFRLVSGSSIVENRASGAPTVTLTDDGDSLLAFDGSTVPSSGSSTGWIAGVSGTAFVTGAPAANRTNLPSALAVGVTAVQLTSSTTSDIDNGGYNVTSISGTASTIRQSVNNISNWSTHSKHEVECTTGFVVQSPPNAVSFSPTDNATGVAVSDNLVINFNKTVQKGTGNILIKKVSDNSTVETINVTSSAVTVSDSTVTINPANDLLNSTAYYVEISSTAIKDSSNAYYAGISGVAAWNFSSVFAADTTAPSVSTIDDGDADNLVLPNTILTYTVTFSEDIDSSTVSAADFENAGTSEITIGTITETSPGVFSVQVTPTEGTVILRIPSGAVITDVVGNNLVAPVTDNDTISVNLPPVATSFSPSDDATGVATNANLVVTFNKTVQKGAGNILVKKVSDNSIVETIAVTSAAVTVSGSTVTINPTFDLLSSTIYYVEIPNTAIKDTVGDTYAGITGAAGWSFTTGADSVAPSVQNLALSNDTGTSGDLVTSDPRIAATISDSDGGGSSYAYEIDWNNDGVVDATQAVGLNSPFVYDLTSHVGYGSVTAKVRGVQNNASGAPLTGAWSTISFVYESTPQNSAPTVQNLGLYQDTGTPGDLVTSNARIIGSLSDSDGGGVMYGYEIDWNSDGTVDAVVDWNDDGISHATDPVNLNTQFSYNLSNRVSYGTINVKVRGVQLNANGTTTPGEWSTLSFDYQAPPVNQAPTLAVSRTVSSLPENLAVTSSLFVGTVVVSDDGLGSNSVWLSGPDAAMFSLSGGNLYLKSGVTLDYETNPTLNVTVNVDDPTVGTVIDSSQSLSIDVTNVNETSAVSLVNAIGAVAENTVLAERMLVSGISVASDGLGTDTLSLAGADAALFEIDGNSLYLKAGTSLDFEAHPSLNVTIQVSDSTLGVGAGGSKTLSIIVSNVNEAPNASWSDLVPSLPENTVTTNHVLIGTVVIVDDGLGTNLLSISGPDASLFELDGHNVYLKAGATLDYETHPALQFQVDVNDEAVGTSVDVTLSASLQVTNVSEAVTVTLVDPIHEIAELRSMQDDIPVASIVVSDDGAGTVVLSLWGDDADCFKIVGTTLFLKAGTVLDRDLNPVLDVSVNADIATTALSIQVVNMGPAAPSVVELTTASDTGVSNSDDLTNLKSPTVEGTGIPGLHVYVYVDGVMWGTGVVGSDGHYTVTLSDLDELGDGTHAITARLQNEAGYLGELSQPLNITLDVTAPGMLGVPDLTSDSDRGLLNDDNLTYDLTPTFVGSGTPDDQIEVYANGTLVGGTTVDASGHYSVTTTTLNVGFNYITAKAIDPAGNQSPSSSGLSVTIDLTVPDVYTAMIAGSNDFKIYAVSLKAGERLSASITTPGELNTYLRIFDSSWNEVLSNDDTIDAVSGQTLTDSFLTYRATQDGLFYVGVSSATNPQYNPTSSVIDIGSTTVGNVGDYTLRLDHDPNDAPTFNNTTRILTTSSTSTVGTTVGAVLATDPESDVITYTLISEDQVPFVVDSTTGEIKVNGALLPYEAYEFQVQASDSFGKSTLADVSVLATYQAGGGNTGGSPGSPTETMGTHFYGLITPMVYATTLNPYGGTDPTTGGNGSGGTGGSSGNGSGSVSNVAGGSLVFSSTSGFGFRRDRYTPDLDLPALGDQGAVYTPTGDDFLADAMTGFTRGSHGDIVTNNTPPLTTPGYRTWDADGGNYVEESILTRTTIEEGWEENGEWHYEVHIMDTYSFTTTFTSNLGVEFELLQEGSNEFSFRTSGTIDPASGSTVPIEFWSFSSTATDTYTFNLDIDSSKVLSNGDLATVTGSYLVTGYQVRAIESGNIASGSEGAVISTMPRPTMVTAVSEGYETAAPLTASLSRGVSGVIIQDTLDISGEYEWSKQITQDYGGETPAPVHEEMIYDASTNSHFDFQSLTDIDATVSSTSGTGLAAVDTTLELDVYSLYQIETNDEFTYHLSGETAPGTLTPAPTTSHSFSGGGDVTTSSEVDSYIKITSATAGEYSSFWSDEVSGSTSSLTYDEHGPGYQYDESGSSGYHYNISSGLELKSLKNEVLTRFASTSHAQGTNIDAASRPDGDTWTVNDTRTVTRTADTVSMVADTSTTVEGWNSYSADSHSVLWITDHYSDPYEMLWMRDESYDSVSGQEYWTSSEIAHVNASSNTLTNSTHLSVVIDTLDTTKNGGPGGGGGSSTEEVSDTIRKSSTKINHQKDNVRVELKTGSSLTSMGNTRTWNGTASTHTEFVIDAVRTDVNGDGTASEDEATLTTSFTDHYEVNFSESGHQTAPLTISEYSKLHSYDVNRQIDKPAYDHEESSESTVVYDTGTWKDEFHADATLHITNSLTTTTGWDDETAGIASSGGEVDPDGGTAPSSGTPPAPLGDPVVTYQSYDWISSEDSSSGTYTDEIKVTDTSETLFRNGATEKTESKYTYNEDGSLNDSSKYKSSSRIAEDGTVMVGPRFLYQGL